MQYWIGTEFFIILKNPVKVLVCVTPKSMITFKSKAYGGSISDKEITNRSKFLDFVPPYTPVMYNKGFNLGEECANHFIIVYVPPGRKGAAQMTPAEIIKTKKIANMRN